jgi:hypothetical protein
MNIGQRRDHLGRKAAGICTALVGGIILIRLPFAYKEEVDFQSKASSATGTVIKTEEKVQTSGGVAGIVLPSTTREFISTVKFQTNQAELIEFTTSSACSSQRDCENKKVSVLYDPSHPSDARIDSGLTPEGKLKSGLVLSIVLLLLGICIGV